MIGKEQFNQEFGQRIKLARRNIGMKAEKLADLAGITPQFLSEVERGKKGIGNYNLAILAQSLDVTADYLLFGRTDLNDAKEQLAEHLAALPPAQMEMAADVLEYTLKMVKENIPK